MRRRPQEIGEHAAAQRRPEWELRQDFRRTSRILAQEGASGQSRLNPSAGRGLYPSMDSWVGFVGFLVVWIVLQTWVLPKLGVST